MNNVEPRIGIGMRECKGGGYLQEVLDWTLVQRYSDFEFIILDSMSTDDWEQIWPHTQPRTAASILLGWNKSGGQGKANRVFELSSEECLKWVAHDDLCAPEFLEPCVEVLDRDPSMVLCHSEVRFIKADGNLLRDYDPNLNAVVRPQVQGALLLGISGCHKHQD